MRESRQRLSVRWVSGTAPIAERLKRPATLRVLLGAMVDQPSGDIGSAGGPRAGSGLLRFLRAQARWLIAGAIGLAIGYLLGAQYAFLDSSGQGGLLPPTFGVTMATVGIVGGLGLIGLVLLIPRSTRAAGQVLLACAAFVIAGFQVGEGVGPRWQFPTGYRGEVVLELAAPAGTRLTGPVTCWTEANGERIVRVDGGPIGEIGIDRLGVRLAMHPGSAAAPASGSLELLVNDRAGYSGSADLSELGARSSTGRVTFAGLRPDRFRIGGWVSSADGLDGPNTLDLPEGLESLSGSLSWRCSAEEVPIPGPDEVQPELVQGWFTLSGLVSMAPPCSSEGPCLPYGYAMGACTADAPLRVEALETVVPWRDGTRARLRLVPERTAATLTVTVDDGRPPETVRGPATLTERPSGAIDGSIGDRTLVGDFPLRDGQLMVRVEWFCGDNFEH